MLRFVMDDRTAAH